MLITFAMSNDQILARVKHCGTVTFWPFQLEIFVQISSNCNGEMYKACGTAGYGQMLLDVSRSASVNQARLIHNREIFTFFKI